MTRKQVLDAIRAAGARNDQQAFIRLYVENRVSRTVAEQAFREGKRFGEFVRARDAA